MVSRAWVGGAWVYSADEVIDRYRSVHAHESTWAKQNAFVRPLVAALRLRTPTAAYKAMVAASDYVRWLSAQDVPLDAEAVFTPENVEWYCATQLQRLGEHSRSTKRGALRQIGRASTRRAAWSPPDTRFAKPLAAEPYCTDERRGLRCLVPVQPTEARRRFFAGVLGLGFGFGLRGVEMRYVHASDLFERRGALHVRVRGERARTVPARAALTQSLLQLALEYPEGPLLGPYRDEQKAPMSRMKARLIIPDNAPALSLRRLRTSWMVDVLNDGVPLGDFAAAAGATDLRLGSLLPHLHRKDTAAVIAQLTGTN